jgi:single-strand DNA-binding protein
MSDRDPTPGPDHEAAPRDDAGARPVNQVFLSGTCVEAPDIRYTPSGNPVATFRIEIASPARPPSGARRLPPALVDLVCWDETALSAGRALAAGARIAIEGVLQARSLAAGAAKRIQKLEIHVCRFEILK